MRTPEGERARFARGWGSGKSDGTVCGFGSTLKATEVIREWLPSVVRTFDFRSICDAGAGDLHWIARVVWPAGTVYQPYDLVVRHPFVQELDITAELLPECDLILCRYVLNHLNAEQVERALWQFQCAGRYLLATQFPSDDRTPGDFHEYDLRTFGLGEPLTTHPDARGELALWSL